MDDVTYTGDITNAGYVTFTGDAAYMRAILYTCWTAPSLTFDLLCRSRLMLDEAKLSPTSASICTTNRMLGEALSNKCFIMPKSLNDNVKKLSLLWTNT